MPKKKEEVKKVKVDDVDKAAEERAAASKKHAEKNTVLPMTNQPGYSGIKIAGKEGKVKPGESE